MEREYSVGVLQSLGFLFFAAVIAIAVLWPMYKDRGERLEELQSQLTAARAELRETFACWDLVVEDFDIKDRTGVAPDDVYLQLRFVDEDGETFATCEQSFHRDIPAG